MHKHTTEKWWLSGFNSALFNRIDDNIQDKSILHRKTNLPQQIEASCLQTEQLQLILQVGELFLPTNRVMSRKICQ
jgi:hypothetical protein